MNMHLATELFGVSGVRALTLLRRVCPALEGVFYHFMPDEEWVELAGHDQPKAAMVYWYELQCPAHLAAATSLLRQDRWLTIPTDLVVPRTLRVD